MRDPVYWQRLRRDKASGMAALLAIGACGLALLAMIGLMLPGTQADHRGNPVYWALLLPFGWWGVELANYTPRTAWTLAPALVVGPAVALACAAVSLWSGQDWTPLLAVFGLSALFAVLGAVFYRRSLLRREGPARERV